MMDTSDRSAAEELKEEIRQLDERGAELLRRLAWPLGSLFWLSPVIGIAASWILKNGWALLFIPGIMLLCMASQPIALRTHRAWFFHRTRRRLPRLPPDDQREVAHLLHKFRKRRSLPDLPDLPERRMYAGAFLPLVDTELTPAAPPEGRGDELTPAE